MNVISSDSSSDETSISDGSKSLDDSFMEICAFSMVQSEQEVKCHCLQVAWDYHATILRHEKQFKVQYHMSYESFIHLAKLLELVLLKTTAVVSTVVVNQKSARNLPSSHPRVNNLLVEW